MTDQMKSTEEIARRLRQQVQQVEELVTPADKQARVFFPKDALPPLPEGVCKSCGGTGSFKYDVRYTDPKFGKLFPCPDCETGREVIRRRHLRTFANSHMPREYKEYRLHHFLPDWIDENGLPDELLEGKRVGIGMALQFLQNPDHRMTEREAYRIWGDLYRSRSLAIPPGHDKKVAKASDRVRCSLVLHGMNGTGKTAMASAIANELMERGISVLYIRVDDYIQRAQSTNGPQSQRDDDEPRPTEMEVVSAAQMPNVLILDDMNVSRVTDYGRKIMEMVIRHRVNEGKPTIITLNASEQEFEAEWQPRIASVVFGAAHWVPFAGPPLRDERHSLDAW